MVLKFWLVWMGLIGGTVLTAALTGCAVGPDYQQPSAPQAAAYKEGAPWKAAQPRDDISKGTWYEIFGDAKLNALETEAQLSNQSLKAAFDRVNEARAVARVTAAQFFPAINFAPQAARQRTTPNDGQEQAQASGRALAPHTFNTIQIPFDLSYELDLWGRIRRSFESVRAQAEARQADFENVLLTLKSDLASDYFALNTADSQIKVTRDTIEARQKELDLTQARFQGGISTQLDVEQAKAELASAQTQLASNQQNRAILEHAIAVLLGQPPENFSLPFHPLTLDPPHVPLGLPSDLLERRPDVAQAERTVVAQNAQIGAALAAYFPVVRLTGYAEFDSGDIATLFNWPSRAWSIGPSVNLPIFDGGQISAQVRQQRAAYDEAVANYRQQVLTAFQDVEDNLSNLHYLSEQAQSQRQATDAYQNTLKLTQDRYKGGLVSYFDVTLAERNYLTAQQQQVQISGDRITSTVRLIKSLGGGWADATLLNWRAPKNPVLAAASPGKNGTSDGSLPNDH